MALAISVGYWNPKNPQSDVPIKIWSNFASNIKLPNFGYLQGQAIGWLFTTYDILHNISHQLSKDFSPLYAVPQARVSFQKNYWLNEDM